MNKHHPERDCGPCSLCTKAKFYYTHTEEWNDEQKDFLKSVEADLPPFSCICKACANDVKRNLHKYNYTPRWRKPKFSCAVSGCRNVQGLKLCTVTDNTSISQLFDLNVDSSTAGVTLCTDHYNVVYRSLPDKAKCLSHQKCKICSRDMHNKKDRHCPNPEKIEQFYRDRIGSDVSISGEDVICITCYKAHKTILENEDGQSYDDDLLQLIDSLKQSNTDSPIDKALKDTTISVAESLYKQEAVLLPVAHDMLTSAIRETSDHPVQVSKQHLFSFLKQTLHKHLSCSTELKSAGTLLYRNGGNVLLALTKALHLQRKSRVNQSERERASSNETFDELSARFCATMNTKLHKQAKMFIQKNNCGEIDLTCLDIDNLVASLDPSLWSMITTLTKSYRDVGRNNNQSLTHCKKLRCVYCMCVLLFTTNNQCSTPLHVLLTDVLASHIGTNEKIKVFNQLGAVASLDTHARYCQDIVQKKKQSGKLTPTENFVAISVDNIDFLQSFAAVYSGDQHRSWHGTTVQALVYPATNTDSGTAQASTAPSLPTEVTATAHGAHSLPLSTEPNSAAQCTLSGTAQASTAPSLPTEVMAIAHGAHSLPLSTQSNSAAQCTLPPLAVLSGTAQASTAPSLPTEVTVRDAHSLPHSTVPTSVAKGTLSLSCAPAGTASEMHTGTDDSLTQPPRKRARTEKEGGSEIEMYAYQVELLAPMASSGPYDSLKTHKITSYRCNREEINATENFNETLLSYIAHRHSVCKLGASTSEAVPTGLQEYYTHLTTTPSETDATQVSYLRVLDRNADSPETILEVVSWLYNEFLQNSTLEHLLVTGDEKTYSHMVQLKKEYGEALDWLVPFPGDFHLLRIYQEVLMSAYWDAGLKQLAAASGYRGETLTSLSRCSNFTNTTKFFFEVWEALFHHTMDMLCQHNQTTVSQVQYCNHKEYTTFVTAMGSQDENWRFWSQFILKDCSVFLTLYLAVRMGNWDLRVAALKEMAALFFAFNRPHYQKLIVQHLSDLLVMPREILRHLEAGKFVASLTGRPGHHVAIDEAHEMKINKDLKSAIVHPSTENMNRLSLYIGHRTKMISNLQRQLMKSQPRVRKEPQQTTNQLSEQKSVQNITSIMDKIRCDHMLPLTCNGTGVLRNVFTNKEATALQRHDLLSMRKTGQTDFETHVTYTFLTESSVRPSLKRKSIRTFAEVRITKQRLSNAEKEKKLISLCLKKRLKAKNYSADCQCEQYIELPRAIADSNGMPQKGDKSNARHYLVKRYNMDSTELCTPDTIIYDGMFIIQTTPIPNMTMENYVKFLLNRFVKQFLDRGVSQVHIVFDNPTSLLHPKCIEHEHRDKSTTLSQHTHINFSAEMKVPSKWSELLQCRTCKRSVVTYVGDSILHNATSILKDNQKIFVAGHGVGENTNTAEYTTSTNSHNCEPNLTCNADEADLRIWLHANKSLGKKLLVYSPDTDVMHIALLMVNPLTQDVYIQTNKLGQPRTYISITKLTSALNRDPDLAGIPQEDRPKVLVSLYALSGTDFTSFFMGHGKVTFMKAFFEHANFICEDSNERPGSLAAMNAHSGFYSFMRLIGAVYFRAHRPAFPEYSSPESLFNSISDPNMTVEDRHTHFIECIRTAMWDRIVFEDQLLPSVDALKRHYLRAKWVISYWKQSSHNIIQLPPILTHGWKLTGEKLQIDWESETNTSAIRERVSFLMKGCGCKHSRCINNKCSCFKNKRMCGPGCSCIGCNNNRFNGESRDDSEPEEEDEDPSERLEEEIIFMDQEEIEQIQDLI